jgi:lysozyme family protein
MSNKNFDDALAHTLELEGGWSDHPHDPGGKTFRGVTQKAWEAYVGHPVTAGELRALREGQIVAFYFEQYWLKAGCHHLPAGIDAHTFDIAVNSGPYRAGLILQTSINDLGRVRLRKDGLVGPKTAAAAAHLDPVKLTARMGFRRLTFYSRLRGWIQGHFKNGWRWRACDVVAFSSAIACGRGKSVIDKAAQHSPASRAG